MQKFFWILLLILLLVGGWVLLNLSDHVVQVDVEKNLPLRISDS